jgi:hypothetical protein
MAEIDELLKILREIHEQKIPFNKLLGLRLDLVNFETVRVLSYLRSG